MLFCTCLLEGLTTIGETVSQWCSLQTVLSLRKGYRNGNGNGRPPDRSSPNSPHPHLPQPPVSTCLFSIFMFLLCLITNKFGEEICTYSCLLNPSWIQRTDLSSPIHHVSRFYWFWTGEWTFLPCSPSASPPPTGIPLVMGNSLPHIISRQD